MAEDMCDGICVRGYEILPGGGMGVAYAHPDCPAHGWSEYARDARGELDGMYERNQDDADAAARLSETGPGTEGWVGDD